MSDTVIDLQKWYANYCNGVWEHGHGVRIDTLDNPGWKVTIDLGDTPFENVAWTELSYDRSPSDWVRCSKKDKQFNGYGDPSKLDFILRHFLTQVKEVSH